MSYVISWVGTKDGQGLTSTLLAVAHEIARSNSVLVLDADMSLQDRDGQQLNGMYQARAFLTSSGPQPRVETTTQFTVTIGP